MQSIIRNRLSSIEDLWGPLLALDVASFVMNLFRTNTLLSILGLPVVGAATVRCFRVIFGSLRPPILVGSLSVTGSVHVSAAGALPGTLFGRINDRTVAKTAEGER